MNKKTYNTWLDQNTVAKLLAVEPETLTKGQTHKCYDLKPEKRGRNVYYPRDLIKEQFFGNRRLIPLLNRKNAAKRLSLAPSTIANRDSTHEHDLDPVKLGSRIVRYHPDVIEAAKQARINRQRERLRP